MRSGIGKSLHSGQGFVFGGVFRLHRHESFWYVVVRGYGREGLGRGCISYIVAEFFAGYM